MSSVDDSWDDEKTPVAPHPRPAPTIVRAGLSAGGPRHPTPPPLPKRTPHGGLLAPLGRIEVPDPEAFKGDEPPTGPPLRPEHRASRLVRNWAACSPSDQALIESLALRLRPGLPG